MESKNNTIKRFIRTSVLIFLVLILIRFLNYYHHSNISQSDLRKIDSISFLTTLLLESDSMNKNAPMWTDSQTEFISAAVMNKNTFQYNFALKIDTTKYNMPKFREIMRKNIYDNFINTVQDSIFKAHNVSVIYNYTDTANNPLFKLIFNTDTNK